MPSNTLRGDAKTTKWGAERAKNGHPEPFTLDYIEVGNENHSAMYAKYYNRFYKRIREAYPDITINYLPADERPALMARRLRHE